MSMSGVASTRLFEALSSLPLGTWVELVSVLEGIRPGATTCVLESDVELWQTIAAEAGLACVEAPYALIEVTSREGNHILARGHRSAGARRELVLATSLDAAWRIAGTKDDLERGRALGYPECCSVAYAGRAGRAGWLEPLLEAASPDVLLPAVCNRISALIDGCSLVPDYFPCSLACVETSRLGIRVAGRLTQLGLGSLVDRIVGQLSRSIMVTPDVCIRLPRAGRTEKPDVLPRQLGVLSDIDQMEFTSDRIIARWNGEVVGTWAQAHESIRVLHFAPERM